LSMPAAPPSAPSQSFTSPPIASPSMSSAFNLSSPAAAPAAQQPSAPAAAPSYSGFSNMDAWGSNDVWASSAPSQPAATSTTTSHTQPKSPGWGLSTPQVTQDDDFGGWSSAAPTTTNTTTSSKPAGGFGGDDLFSNVWE
jgi:stromal membrane-associated protein